MLGRRIEYNLKDYVTDVRNVNVSFDEGTLTIEFIAVTPYGGGISV